MKARQSKLSVAMCTFNGGRFLEAQLQSIVDQTRPPDELVVCDDGSVDNTTDLVSSFARTVPFDVRFSVNERRLGSAKNFEQAIAACTGDLIALADQDDVWHADKLEVQERLLTSTALDVVFSDADVVDSDLRPLGYSLWEALGFSDRERALSRNEGMVSLLLRTDVVTGATLLFRSALRSAILPIPDGWVHDAWIALVAAATGRLGFLERPLIKYRQHPDNQIGAERRDGVAPFLKAASDGHRSQDVFVAQFARYLAASERLHELSSLGIDPSVFTGVSAKILHLGHRGRLPVARLRRLPTVLGELASGRYHRYSRGWRSAGKDLLLR